MTTKIFKRAKTFQLLFAMSVAPFALQAQVDFKVDGRDVQVHGFFSQGFAYSDQNNFATMDTSHGSFDFTDGGMNVSTQVTDKFRVGAQGYIRSIGELGRGRFQLDWAQGDYKFKDWLGVRAGKVKTSLGLYNDSQDLEFLHTWALLPQALYPIDLRSVTIAHIGADIYGDIAIHRAGSISYTVYGGQIPSDRSSGTYYSVEDQGGSISKFHTTGEGFDVHWNTPVDGLKIGTSFLAQQFSLGDTIQAYGDATVNVASNPYHITSGYGDYARGRWHFNGEYKKSYERIVVNPGNTLSDGTSSGFFVAAAYRVSKHLELGAYNSRFFIEKPANPAPAANHIFDQTITARVDITHFWTFKVEGHFMNGYGDTYSAHGFYLRDNPDLKPTTDLLVVRTGFNF